MSHDCALCGQIAGRPEEDLIARLLPHRPYARRILVETPSFAVIPSLGPLTPGHSLVCPKDHLRSFAELKRQAHDEYEELKRALKASLTARYAAGVALFEHGSARGSSRVVCTVDHAHMHFVPVPSQFEHPLDAGRSWTALSGASAELADVVADREYVYYETPEGAASVAIAGEHPFASQYMRKLIAAQLGRSERWNWRDVPDAEAADEVWRSWGGRRSQP